MLSVQARGLKVTDRIESYVAKKTGHISRVMPSVADVKVELRAEKTKSKINSQVAQVTVRDDRGAVLRAEERNSDLFTAIDLVMDKLDRQIRRYRGKKLSQRRKSAGLEVKPIALLNEPDQFEEELEPRIVRQKQFSLQPMSVDEAFEQAQLLDHDFFVFFNRENNAVNVLYKRKDGDYGILMPDVPEMV